MARASRNEVGLGKALQKPNTRGKGQSRVCFRLFELRAGDDDVVRCVRFAVRAEGAEGLMVWLAFVAIGAVPGIDADHAE